VDTGKKESGKKGDSDKPKPKVVVGKTKTEGKKAANLSDAQLKKVNERMNMEQQYARLTAPSPSKGRAVTKFFADIAVNVAKTQITAVANDVASQKIGAMLSSKGVGSKAIKLPTTKDPTKPFKLDFPAPKGKKKFL
jgi:hypothetical protein